MAVDIVNEVRSKIGPDRRTHKEAVAYAKGELARLQAFVKELAANPAPYKEHEARQAENAKIAAIVTAAKKERRSARAAIAAAREAGEI